MEEGTRPSSDYLFVEVAAQRCIQLMRGAKPKVETEARKHTTTAVEEVDQGEIAWEIRPEGEEPEEAAEAEEESAVEESADEDEEE